MRASLAILACLPTAAVLGAAERVLDIANPLRLDWPGELVHVDLPAGAPAPVRATVGDADVPVQIERSAATEGGGQRAWLRVAFPRGDDGKPAASLRVVLRDDGEAPASTLALREQADALIVENPPHYRLRLARLPGALAQPQPVAEVTAPIRAIEVDGAGATAGMAFAGASPIAHASTEVVERGPVLVTVRWTYAGSGDARYVATMRCVAGDPWIAFDEAHRLGEGARWSWTWKEGLAPDSALWVPWFGFERFGGNSQLQHHPLRPQQAQRGAFVTLQPVWTQRPGAGQDFIATRSGPTPRPDAKPPVVNPGYDGAAPALAVVATLPTRWRDPYRQLVEVHVEGDDRARVEAPLVEGSRSIAFIAGRRDLIDTTGRLDAIVRRHGDWTLDKQMRCVLEWTRDPAKAGPSILIGRERLDELRRAARPGEQGPLADLVRAHLARLREWQEQAKAGGPEAGAARRRIDGVDGVVLRLIAGDEVKPSGGPSAGAWIGTRYQADGLNPTSATRSLKKGLPIADLTAAAPFGGPAQAAIGYIFSDADQWPGWLNGWNPGNPNFHTDKYAVAILAAAAMRDHPHSDAWLAQGLRLFRDDLARVFLPGDGVGYECPGYSTYSFLIQLELARVFEHCGMGNPVAAEPLCRASGRWHRHLLTPGDPRIGGKRHQAPIGDTHRWGLEDGRLFGELAAACRTADPAFSAEMQAIWKLFRAQGMEAGAFDELVHGDATLPAAPLATLDWGSHAFHGFGAVLRSRFGTPDETFCTLKAGPATGHYHNDAMSVHFYGCGVPLALDYNCSYHPRGDHAALHNSVTFGRRAPFTHIGDAKEVDAAEQLDGAGKVLAFAAHEAADVVVAEREGASLRLAPVDPHDARFAYPYPRRALTAPVAHRRWLALVKHPAGSRLSDYLVVRDRCAGDEPAQLNLHLLSRELRVELPFVRAIGQWDVDATLFVARAPQAEAVVSRWWYADEKAAGKEGMDAIRASDGKALIPSVDHRGPWTHGEYQQWLQLRCPAGSDLLWVLYPRRRGAEEPAFAATPDGGVRVALGDEADEVWLGAAPAGIAGDAVLRRAGATTVLLAPGAAPPVPH